MKKGKDNKENDEKDDEETEESYFAYQKFKISLFVENVRVLNRKRPTVE
jgi:hypothetical protein